MGAMLRYNQGRQICTPTINIRIKSRLRIRTRTTIETLMKIKMTEDAKQL